MKIDIIDDFLTDYQHQSLLRTFSLADVPSGTVGSPFPWYFTNDLNGEVRLGNFYFSSIIMDEYHILNEYWLPVFTSLLSKLNVSLNTVWRVKANLYPRTQWKVHHESHTDYSSGQNLSTCLYYVNDSNRVTIFDGKKKIRCKGNRAIIFDGSNPHHSTTPTDVNYGCSINIDYRMP